MAHATAHLSNSVAKNRFCKDRHRPRFRVQKGSQSTEKRTLNRDQIIRAAIDLDDRDVQHIIDALEGLLEARRAEAENDLAAVPIDSRQMQQQNTGMRGWYEQKNINGCGPYRYFRFRSGGRVRSVYCGKVPSAATGGET